MQNILTIPKCSQVDKLLIMFLNSIECSETLLACFWKQTRVNMCFLKIQILTLYVLDRFDALILKK